MIQELHIHCFIFISDTATCFVDRTSCDVNYMWFVVHGLKPASLTCFNAVKRTHTKTPTAQHPLSFTPKPLTLCHHKHTHTHTLLPHHPAPPVTSWPQRLSRCHGNKLISIQAGFRVVRTREEEHIVKVCPAGDSHSFLAFTGHHTHAVICFPFFSPLLCNLTTLPFKKEKLWWIVCHYSVLISCINVFIWAWENAFVDPLAFCNLWSHVRAISINVIFIYSKSTA